MYNSSEVPLMAQTRRGYATVKIPVELIELVDKAVGQLGYRSRAELIKEAIREKLTRLGIIQEATTS